MPANRSLMSKESFMTKNKQIVLICFLLATATLLAFWKVNYNDFISLDDPLYVTENHHVTDSISLEGIRWVFTNIYANFWHPLTMISLMLDAQLYGLNPHGYHLTSLLFHIANTLLLFLVLNRMTEEPWKSAFAAALFALHPLHVESVAWVAERKDVLSAFFWMLTLLAYAFYVERPRLKTYLAALAFFVMGLMAKPMLVTLPFVMLLLDYWPLQRLRGAGADLHVAVTANGKKQKPVQESRLHAGKDVRPAEHKFEGESIRRLIVEKVPFFALIPLFSVLAYSAEGKSVAHHSPSVWISNAFVSYVTYIVKMIWPTGLAVYYPHPGMWPFWQTAGSAFFLFAVTLTVILPAGRFPYLVTGWLWFAGALAPVIGIVQIGSFAMADRYTYLPLIGLFIMVAWGVPDLLKKGSIGRKMLLPAAAVILACLSLLTWIQVGYWRNSISLYGHALEVTPDNYFIYNNRAIVYAQSGDYKRAISDFNKAIEINQDSPDAFYNRGNAYARLGNSAEAITDFSRAIEVNSQDSRAYNNRGIAYHKLGRDRLAIDDYGKAIELEPESAEAYCNRGNAWYNLGEYGRSISDYDKAIEIDPKIVSAYINRANLYDTLGRHAEAIENLKAAAGLGSEKAKALLSIQEIKPSNLP
jgi:Tfp pilus assembly protein PilF